MAAPRARTPSGAIAGTRTSTTIGPDGAGPNGFGGVQIGDSDYWIGDYTVEPENGGVGVFAHEFGHDLGLPDLYDTSGNTGGAENSTGFWTLYSSGSYGSSGKPKDGIGTEPVHMSAYEKLFLGWSNYEVVNYQAPQDAGQSRPCRVQHHQEAQQLVIPLPPKGGDDRHRRAIRRDAPVLLGSGNDLDNSMTRAGVVLPAGPVTLNAFQGQLRHRDRVGLPLPDRQRHAGPHQPVSDEPSARIGKGITDTSGGV